MKPIRSLLTLLMRVARRLGRRTFLHHRALDPLYRFVTAMAAGPADEHGLVTLNWRGGRIVAPTNDVTLLPSLLDESFERLELDLLLSLARSGMSAVDVGANIGVYTIPLARVIAPGVVDSFEPHPTNFEILRTNVASNHCNNVRIHQLAVASTSGSTVLFATARGIGTHSLVLRPELAPDHITVQATRLDEVPTLGAIDILKVDVEGAEPEVLIGARQLMDRHLPLLLCEFNPEARERFPKLISERWPLVLAFHPRRRELSIVPSDNWHFSEATNILAVPPRLVRDADAAIQKLRINVRN